VAEDGDLVTLVLGEAYRNASKEVLSDLLDREIEGFSQYMEKLTDSKAAGRLIPMERALIKTYLIHKLKLMKA
jgi:molybdopterin biosynthesis enzyme MoaB